MGHRYMTTTAAPLCLSCLRFKKGWTCEAFPKGIPNAIINNEVDHRNPVDGDHGLQFKSDGKDDDAVLDQLFKKG